MFPNRFRLLSLLIVCCSWTAIAQLSFPTNEDLRHLDTVNDPRLSPDGKSVLFRVTDSSADGAHSHLWITDLAANTTRQITFSPPSDKRGEHSGEWMPDGSAIVFIAKRSGHAQLFRLSMSGGEAQPLDLTTTPVVDATKLPDYINTNPSAKSEEPKPEPIDVSQFAIAPDGKWIAIVAKDPETPAEKKEKEDKADAVLVDHELHGNRLYLLDPKTSKLTSVNIAPEVSSISWSADSSRLVVIADPPNHLDDLGPASKTYVVEVSNPDQGVQLSAMPAAIDSAVWSADGSQIYFVGQAKRDTPPGYVDLYVYVVNSKAIRDLTDGFAGSVERERPIALRGGGVFKAVATGVKTTALLFAGNSDSSQTLSFPNSLNGSFNTNAKQTGWVFLGTSSTSPVAIYYTDDLRKAPKAIAMPKLSPKEFRTVQTRLVRYPSENFTIEGLLSLPPEASQHKVPLVIDVHGGPAGAWQDGFDPFVAYLNGQGWAVFRPNIRGSSNYGAEFVAANKNDLGGGDYRDLMNGVDYLLKNYPLDDNRMALFGYSYGGEMAGFVEGKTNRFKAIVSGAPVIDQFSEYGTEDGSWYDRWYFGKPWERFEDAWRQSPLSGAAKAKTPFMLLQGEADTTDPLGESQQMYRALRQMGVPVELVTYPRENHGGLAGGIFGRPTPEPWHGFDARRRIVEFINKNFEAAK